MLVDQNQIDGNTMQQFLLWLSQQQQPQQASGSIFDQLLMAPQTPMQRYPMQLLGKNGGRQPNAPIQQQHNRQEMFGRNWRNAMGRNNQNNSGGFFSQLLQGLQTTPAADNGIRGNVTDNSMRVTPAFARDVNTPVSPVKNLYSQYIMQPQNAMFGMPGLLGLYRNAANVYGTDKYLSKGDAA